VITDRRQFLVVSLASAALTVYGGLPMASRQFRLGYGVLALDNQQGKGVTLLRLDQRNDFAAETIVSASLLIINATMCLFLRQYFCSYPLVRLMPYESLC
jgi:hypothetical protein